MRVRIHYQKTSALKFTSTLDIQAIWQRAFKRARLAVQYSEGFHPQPKIQIPFPLPLGFTAQDEIVDVWLEEEFPVNIIIEKLKESLPEGLNVRSLELIESDKKSIASSAEHADYKVKIYRTADDCGDLRTKIDHLLARGEITRTRNKKSYDLRPLILSIGSPELENEICVLRMRLQANPSRTGRPDEVMAELGFEAAECDVERLNVHYEV